MSNAKKSGPNASDDQNRKGENNDNIIGINKNANKKKSFVSIAIQEVIAGSAHTIVLTFQNELFAAGYNKFG